MKKSTKYIIAGIGFFLLVLHFSLSALYAFRRHYDMPIVESVATRYAFPFFHQGYQLFVTLPEYDSFIEVRYRENGLWSSFQRIRDRYKYDLDSKISHFEYLTTTKLYSKIDGNLYWKNGVQQTDSIEKFNDYRRAIFLCQRLESANRKLTHSQTFIDSMQIRMVIHFHPLNGEKKDDSFEFSKLLIEIDK